MNTNSQNKLILKTLKTGRRITPIDALNDYGCFRLSGRIYDLKQKGFKIETAMIVRNKKRFASYFLVNLDEIRQKEKLEEKELREFETKLKNGILYD